MTNTLQKITYSTVVLAFALLTVSPAYAIYDPEKQKDCTVNSTDTVCLQRTVPIKKETPSSFSQINTLIEVIIKSDLTVSQKITLLQSVVSNLKKFTNSKDKDKGEEKEDNKDKKTTYLYQDTEVVFQDEEYSFNLGCNTIFGTYKIDNNKITLSSAASTKKACEKDLEEKDKQLIDDLSKIDKIKKTDGNIILSGKDVKLTLELEDQKTYKYQDGTTTIGNNKYSFKIGCNTIFGTYKQDGEDITFSSGAGTLMACSEDLMKKDEQLIKDLSKITTIKKAGKDLILSGEGVELKLIQE